MTRAEIEQMRTNLAETLRYHQETRRLVRAAAVHIAAVTARVTRTDKGQT